MYEINKEFILIHKIKLTEMIHKLGVGWLNIMYVVSMIKKKYIYIYCTTYPFLEHFNLLYVSIMYADSSVIKKIVIQILLSVRWRLIWFYIKKQAPKYV